MPSIAQPGPEQIAGIICVIKTCGRTRLSATTQALALSLPAASPHYWPAAAVDLFAAHATSNIGRKDTASLLCCLRFASCLCIPYASVGYISATDTSQTVYGILVSY